LVVLIRNQHVRPQVLQATVEQVTTKVSEQQQDPRQPPKCLIQFFVRIKILLGRFVAFLSAFCLRPTTGHIFRVNPSPSPSLHKQTKKFNVAYGRLQTIREVRSKFSHIFKDRNFNTLLPRLNDRQNL
jgi:hypothetical protein